MDKETEYRPSEDEVVSPLSATSFDKLSLDEFGLADDSSRPLVQPELVSPEIENAYVFRNVLSSEECRHFIEAMEERDEWSSAGQNKRVRDCQRIVVESDDLAGLLQRRMDLIKLPETLRQCTVTLEHTSCASEEIGTEGVWELNRINPVWRICKYDEGGHFSPHSDGIVIPSPGERSFLTLLVYLSGGFEGGTTAFIDNTLELDVDHEYRKNGEGKVICEVIPEPGLCLLFWAPLIHAGVPVRRSDPDTMPHKYILRSDMFYRRVGDGGGPTCNPESLKILREAQRLEAEGSYSEAIKLYNRLRFKDPYLAELAGIA